MEARNIANFADLIKYAENIIKTNKPDNYDSLNQRLQTIKDENAKILQEVNLIENAIPKKSVSENELLLAVTYSEINDQRSTKTILQMVLPTAEEAKLLCKRMQNEWGLPVKLNDKIILIDASNGIGTCGVFTSFRDPGFIRVSHSEDYNDIAIAFKNSTHRDQFVAAIGLTGDLDSISTPSSGICSNSIYFKQKALKQSLIENAIPKKSVSENELLLAVTYSEINNQRSTKTILQMVLPTAEEAKLLCKRMQNEWGLPVKLNDKIILIDSSNGIGTCGVFTSFRDPGFISVSHSEDYNDIAIAFKNSTHRDQFVAAIGLTGDLDSISTPSSGICSNSIYFKQKALKQSSIPSPRSQPSLLQSRFQFLADTAIQQEKTPPTQVSSRFKQNN